VVYQSYAIWDHGLSYGTATGVGIVVQKGGSGLYDVTVRFSE
jgi:hypothetical protein